MSRLSRKHLFSSVLASIMTIGTVAGVSHASGVHTTTYSGTNGPIVYTAPIGTPPNMTIKFLASTLAGVAVTTDLQATNVPEFSTDGSKVTWMETNGSSWSIHMANANGTNKVTVVTGSGSPVANNPTLSPDGSTIAFDYNNDVYTVSAAASQTIAGATRITTSSGMGIMATKPKYISATKIAYLGAQSGSPCTTFYPGIYVKDLNVAGNGTLLTNSCNDSPNRTFANDFDISPDGQWAVYRGAATNNFIGLVKTDNTGSRIVGYAGTSMSNEPYGRPVFSPDGTKIAFNKGSTSVVTATFDGTTVGTQVAVTFPAGVYAPETFSWAPASAVLSAATTTTAAATTTTVAPTTTAAATTTTVKATTTTVAATTTTSPVTAKYAAATPGVTVTDNKVYNQPPASVADDSAIRVLSIAQNKTLDIETKTPAVCLPNDDELIFLNEGKCIATVVNAKTRAVLRTVRTTVVADDITEVKVGNAIVTLAPVYFKQMSSFLDDKALARIDSIKKQVNAAGSVLVVGYSGTLNGNSPDNLKLSRARALSTVMALKLAGVEGPFAISGVAALDPVSRGKSEADQAKNRRAVIVLIP